MQRYVAYLTSRRAAMFAGALCLALWGCTADEVEIPDLYGPSEGAESLVLTANPDLLVADGNATSIIQAILRDKNGQPIRGRAINFITTDEAGRIAAIGTISSDFGKANIITDQNGIATAIYRAPYRTDATANQSVLIKARTLGTDSNGFNAGLDPTFWYHSVRIELRSAEPRLFPENPANVAPTCNFVVEAPNGFRAPAGILFQTTASDPDGTIVRYEWFFGDDNTRADSPDTAHIFRTPGTWSFTHIVTDDDGGQCQQSRSITITP